jgi:Ca2+-binding RTX toxin-like protein
MFTGTLYQGEDLNHSSTVRLTDTPNADAAQASFTSRLVSGVGRESFETLAAGSYSTLSLTFPGSTGGITATLSSSGSNIVVIDRPTGAANGRYPTDGDQFLEVNGDDFTLSFSQPIAVFGFRGVDLGDFGGSLTLTLANGEIRTVDIGNTVGSGGSTDGSVLFAGIVDGETFTSITFENSAGFTDVFAFDEMIIGDLQQVVPPITGTEGDDELYGNAGDDEILGLGGNDMLNGGKDNDTLNGGAGNDTLFGKLGVDSMIGGAGDDAILDDLSFVLVDGGEGERDRFALWRSNDVTLDLIQLGGDRFRGIEVINLRGDGNHIVLDIDSVLATSDTDILRIIGDTSNTAELKDDFVLVGERTQGGIRYDIYSGGGATLLIDEDIAVTIDPMI